MTKIVVLSSLCQEATGSRQRGQGDMMCSEEMKSTQGEWGFVGAFFSAFTYIGVNTIQGKPVTGKGIAQQAAMGFINPFTSGGPWSSYNPLPF